MTPHPGLRRLVVIAIALLAGLHAVLAGDDLDQLVAEHRRALRMTDGRLAGPGADWLRARAAESQFFMLGEQHGTADIALFAAALFRDLSAAGYRHAVVEVGPWSTPIVERLLRSEHPEALAGYLASSASPLTFPFFFYSEEAAFGRVVTRLSGLEDGALWGLDQEFVAGAEPLLGLLQGWAETEAQKAAVAAAREKARENPMLLGAGEDADWQALVEAFQDSPHAEARRLLDEILISRRIYSPFVGRGGSIYLANREREQYMKTNLQRHLEAAGAAGGSLPKLFFKFGSNHVSWGRSATDVISLGTFARELAWARGLTSFNMMADCLGGQSRDPRSGEGVPCESILPAGETSLRRYALPGQWTLIDLKALRPHKKLWQDLDEDSRRLIWWFDAWLAVPEPTPAGMVPAP